MLIFFSGKMGSGKSTSSKRFADTLSGVLISEDDWLARLYPGEISNFEDFLKYSARLKPLILTHVRSLLQLGVTVILDFPANTINQRKWFKQIIEGNVYPHRLIYLKVSDELCLKRIQQRRLKQPDRKDFDNEEVFRYVTQFFEEPIASEGFNIEVIEEENA